MIFDKTGTLTHGSLQVKSTINAAKKFKVEIPSNQKQLTDQDLKKLLYSCQVSSEHLVARAIREDL